MALAAAAVMPLCSGYVPMHVVRANAGAAVKMAFTDLKTDSGVTAPMGFFDPMGFMKTEAQYAAKYGFYKEVEIKHGRVAMLAALGFVVAEQFHPLFGGTVDAPSAFAFQQTPLQDFWPFVVLFISMFEVQTSVPTFEDPTMTDKKTFWKIRDDHIPGDMGLFGGAQLAKSDPAKFKEIQTKEINNGRLAMLGIAGMVAQELVTGQKLF